jgi:hypothetical protein
MMNGDSMKILRVFPRRTNATPDDSLVHIGSPGLFSEQAEPDRVRISVSFTWDFPAAERLAKKWARIAPTEIGDATLYRARMEDILLSLRFDHILTDPPYLYLKQKFDREFDEALLFETAKRILPDSGFIALYGKAAIPADWLRKLAGVDDICRIAVAMADAATV